MEASKIMKPDPGHADPGDDRIRVRLMLRGSIGVPAVSYPA